jgi:hypothetical protein
MNFFDFTFWQSFVSNLGATIIGVGLGIPVALLINRWIERRTEKERKKKILTLLRDELSYNEIEFDRMQNIDILNRESGVLSSILRNELWKAYSDGGELEWIKNVDLLAKIADTYYSIREL